MLTVDLVIKCHKYHKYGAMPQDALTRYNIGCYQLGQGKRWKVNSPVAWQSYMAAGMHFIMCADSLNLGIETELPYRVTDHIGYGYHSDVTWFDLMTKSMQQLIYAKHSAKSNRKSRYDSKVLCRLLGVQVIKAFAAVPFAHRVPCMDAEWKILTGDLK